MKILKITKTSEKNHTWDIEVPETHAYNIKTKTSNIISHNSSVTQCSTNGIEPVRSLVTRKQAKNGTNVVLTPKYPKWKNNYKLAFDYTSNLNMIKIASSMQKFIDMGISFNTYINYKHYQDGKVPLSVIIKDIMLSYKYGLRTMYYNNTPDDNEEGEINNGCAGGSCSI